MRSASEAMDQLADQLRDARCDLAATRAERAALIAKAKAYVDAEVEACRRELTEAIAELHQLRLSMFSSWRRHEGDRLQ